MKLFYLIFAMILAAPACRSSSNSSEPKEVEYSENVGVDYLLGRRGLWLKFKENILAHKEKSVSYIYMRVSPSEPYGTYDRRFFLFRIEASKLEKQFPEYSDVLTSIKNAKKEVYSRALIDGTKGSIDNDDNPAHMQFQKEIKSIRDYILKNGEERNLAEIEF